MAASHPGGLCQPWRGKRWPRLHSERDATCPVVASPRESHVGVTGMAVARGVTAAAAARVGVHANRRGATRARGDRGAAIGGAPPRACHTRCVSQAARPRFSGRAALSVKAWRRRRAPRARSDARRAADTRQGPCHSVSAPAPSMAATLRRASAPPRLASMPPPLHIASPGHARYRGPRTAHAAFASRHLLGGEWNSPSTIPQRPALRVTRCPCRALSMQQV